MSCVRGGSVPSLAPWEMKCAADKEGNFTLSQGSHRGRLTVKQGTRWPREKATISIDFALSLPDRGLVPNPQE